MSLLIKLAATFLVVFIALAFVLYYYQERLIFFPTVLAVDHQYNFQSHPEEIKLKFDGSDVYALRFRPNTPSKGIVFFFHGNAGALDSWGYYGEEFAQKTSWDIVMIDYPGYGKSGGAISSEEQMREVGQLFINFVTDGINSKVVIFGRSIGTGVASFLAAKNPVDGVILETPFYSGVDLAKILFPWVPSFLVRYKFHSEQWLPLSQGPVMILHGTKDTVIPFAQGEKLAKEIKAQFVTIPGGEHNNLSDFADYWPEIEKFLSSIE